MKVPIGASFAQVPPDKVVVSVGDLTITAKQFDEITDGIQDQYKAFVKGPGRKQFADQLVKVLTLAQEGKRRKLDDDSRLPVAGDVSDGPGLGERYFPCDVQGGQNRRCRLACLLRCA